MQLSFRSFPHRKVPVHTVSVPQMLSPPHPHFRSALHKALPTRSCRADQTHSWNDRLKPECQTIPDSPLPPVNVRSSLTQWQARTLSNRSVHNQVHYTFRHIRSVRSPLPPLPPGSPIFLQAVRTGRCDPVHRYCKTYP